MLELISNNKKLYTRNGSIRLSLENPIFTEGFKGDYSFPFTLDIKRNNLSLGFKHSKQLHRLNPSEENAKVLFNQHLLASGKLRYIDSNNESAKVNLKVGSNNFLNTVTGHSLKELPFESYAFDYDSHKTLYIEDSYINQYETTIKRTGEWTHEIPPYEFACFPVYNDIMFDNVNTYETAWATYKVWNLMPEYYDASGLIRRQNYQVYFPYVAAIIKKIFQFAGYRLVENPFDIGELRSLVLMQMYHRRDIETDRLFSIKDHIADYDILNFLDELRKIFKVEYFFDENNRTARIKFLKDILKGEIVNFEEKVDYKGRKRSFDTRLDGYIFSYAFDENEQTDILSSYLPDSTSSAQEFEILASLTPVAMEENDLPSQHIIHPEYEGASDSAVAVGSAISCLIPKWQQRLYDEEVTLSVPTGSDFLSDHLNYEKLNNVQPKLCFWRGEQLANENEERYGYAMGNSSFLAVRLPGSYSKLSTANLSLKWDDIYSGDDYGLVETFWKEFFYFDQKLKVPEQFTKIMSAYELKELIENIHKIRRIDCNNYLIKKIDATLKENEIAPVRIDAYRI